MFWDIREYETTDSTNLEAGRLLSAGASAGLVVRSDHQTAGRGRLGRIWTDHPGKSMMASLVFEGLNGFHAAVLVSVSFGAAVLESGGRGPDFKWPNDLVYGERKVGGILSESARSGRGEFIITGIGVNAGYLRHELDFPARIPATSLRIEEGGEWDIGRLLRQMLKQVSDRLDTGWEELRKEYLSNLAYVGRRVRIGGPLSVMDKSAPPEGHIDGRVEGIDEQGHLVLRSGEDKLRLASGDLSVLGEG